MSDIPLREYLNKIEGWIRSGEPGRAIAHGRHILALYPDCAWAHRVLGEAYLETGMLSEAQGCFQRALAADPENAIAHIGLSLTYDRQGNLPEAIRQMERAFDVAAGNAAVRAELQALHKRRGDSRSTGPALTRGAMARVYARNGMLERAIAEYQEALRQNPDLTDARAGLVEAQWRAGRRDEAVEGCRHLLEQAPDCLKALLIRGKLLPEEGAEAERQAALTRAQALDPENRLAQSMMGDSSPLRPRDVRVPVLEQEDEPAGGPGSEEGRMKDEDTGEENVSPGTQESIAEGEAVPGESQALPAEQSDEAEAEGEELPEWLLESSPEGTADEAGDEGGELGVGPAPEWMEPEAAGIVAEAEEEPDSDEKPEDEPELPAWMRTLAEQAATEEEAVLPQASADAESAAEPAAGAEEETLEPEATVPATPASVPDWVRRMEEAITDERPPAGAEVLGAAGTGSTAGTAAPPGAGGNPAERQRIRELTLLLRQEPGKYWARIELARRCCQVGDWDGALLQYEELIAGHKMIRAVVVDLQRLLQEETDRVQVYRLLGDAYMESDQIDEALEMYRLARQILRKR